MADTSFTDNSQAAANRVVAAWLNVINNAVYRGRNPNFATTTGSANAQVLTLATGSLYTAASDGDTFGFKAGFSNTGAMTLQVIAPGGSLAAAAVQLGGVALSGGEVISGQPYLVTRIGSTWQLLSLAGTAYGLTLLQAANAAAARALLGSLALLDVEDQVFTGGVVVTSKDLGTIASGTVTPDPGDRPLQHYVNNGAHTLAPSANKGTCLVDITNGASAGAITTSGFTFVTGDSFTTTNGNKFRCNISVGEGGSLLQVQALQ